MFTLVFWFGVIKPEVGIVQGFTTREDCVHFAGSLESSRRLQVYSASRYKGEIDFTFVCEEVK